MDRITNPSIIIVDDEPDYTYLLELALKRCSPRPNIQVLHSGDALFKWLETSERPSLIFLDINMPGTNGFEVLSMLKSVEKYKAIPVVMLTMSETHTDVVSSYDSGASSFLTKPMLYSELTSQMESFTHYWFDFASTPGSSWTKSDGYSLYD